MEQQRFVRKNTNVFETQRRNEKKHTRRTVFYVILFLSVTVVFLGKRVGCGKVSIVFLVPYHIFDSTHKARFMA